MTASSSDTLIVLYGRRDRHWDGSGVWICGRRPCPETEHPGYGRFYQLTNNLTIFSIPRRIVTFTRLNHLSIKKLCVPFVLVKKKFTIEKIYLKILGMPKTAFFSRPRNGLWMEPETDVD
jgi:hypothetical protein